MYALAASAAQYFHEAQRSYQRAIMQDPNCTEARTNLGFVFLALVRSATQLRLVLVHRVCYV